MSTTGCIDCSDKAKQHFKDLDNLRSTTKTQAIEQQKTKAICQDPDTGYFVSDAETAIKEQFHIIEIVSGLQPAANG